MSIGSVPRLPGAAGPVEFVPEVDVPHLSDLEVTADMWAAQARQRREYALELEAIAQLARRRPRRRERGLDEFDLLLAVDDPATGETIAVATRAELRRAAEGGLSVPPDTDAHEPTAAQKRLVVVRDRRCRMPGCRRRPGRCDLDHGVSRAVADRPPAGTSSTRKHTTADGGYPALPAFCGLVLNQPGKPVERMSPARLVVLW